MRRVEDRKMARCPFCEKSDGSHHAMCEEAAYWSGQLPFCGGDDPSALNEVLEQLARVVNAIRDSQS